MGSTKAPAVKALPKDALDVLLKLKADGMSQADIGRRLKVSDGTISNALNGNYIGNVDRLAERIRGEFLNQQVCCPVLGEITSRTCQDERAKPLHFANPLRVRMFRACKDCTHNPKKGDVE